MISVTSKQVSVSFAKPTLGEEEAEASRKTILSGWITQGPRVAEFERAFSAYAGAAAAAAVSNCTTALHLALLALGIGPGDEVVCPSMSFIATSNAIVHTGATPVFADVDPQTYNLDPESARAAISTRTKAILVVHQLGLPADIDRFIALGREFGVHVLEDAACAAGSRYKGQLIGTHSSMACFSFHPRKVITTGEGGMITSNHARFIEEIVLLRQHGMSTPAEARHTANKVVVEQYLRRAYNYRMSDLQAAVGVEQLKKLEYLVGRRRDAAARYNHALAGHPWIKTPYVPEYAEPNYQSFAVQLAADAPVSRNGLMQYLLERGITTRAGVMLAHTQPAYAGHPTPVALGRSEWANEHSLLLPMHAELTAEQIDYVVDCLFVCAERS
jgi:dTDP-4-amino-4,6-dideoxygalactose transaminase